MPSPFPGMDPFLEDPGIFPDLHGRFSIHLSETLQARLPEPYFAVVSERLWVETTQRLIEPDVDVIRSEQPSPPAEGSAGVAVATPARSQPIVITLPHDERRDEFVEIRTRGDDDGERVVTTIEVLSLTNKMPGQRSRELYLQKQQEVLDGDIHLVEIDLLRGGQHTTVVPRARIERKAGQFEYHVSIHRFDQYTKCYIYTVRLEERLPEISVPLLPGDGDVPLDLQAVFDRCYDSGPYRRRVRYDPARINPPLRPDQIEW